MEGGIQANGPLAHQTNGAQNKKNHIIVAEAASLLITNPHAPEWLICNEAADAAAGAYAGHLGDFAKELKDEEFYKAQLWKVVKRISAIELHIRRSEEDLGDAAEGIFAKAEAQTTDQTAETETGMKRKIDNLLKVNGHKLRRIAGTGTG